jgi:hypothetical protein
VGFVFLATIFLSVIAKVLAHGRASSSRVFNPTLTGASPATDAKAVQSFE